MKGDTSMKKIIAILICAGLLGTTACSKETKITKSNDDVSAGETTGIEKVTDADGRSDNLDAVSAVGDIEVDEGLLTVTISIPADFIGELTQDDLDKTVAEKGYISGTLNDDGSVTYVMTKSQHKQMMEDMTKSMDESLQSILDDKDTYPNFESITHNADYTDFTIEYSAEELSLSDTFSTILFYYMGGMYGVFNGEPVENVHVAFVNSETGELISEANSRDMGKSAEE